MPERGKLFVVGDPKQSIYRFRRADIRQMERLRKRIGRRFGPTGAEFSFTKAHYRVGEPSLW